MICPNCKKEIDDDSNFCTGCGYKLVQGTDVAVPEKPKKKINVKAVSIGVVALIAIVCVGVFTYSNSTPESKYNKAEKAFAAGDYASAIKYYTAAGDYEDAAVKLAAAEMANHYSSGLSLMDDGKYEEAKSELEASSGYEEAAEKIQECDYKIACKFLEEKDYLNAADSFKASGGYSDANNQMIQIGQQLVTEKNYTDAVTVFRKAKDVSKNPYVQYANGQIALSGKEYSDAASYFDKAGDILDAKDLYKKAQYHFASDELASKQYSVASTAFEKISGYKDSSDLINACKLMLAKKEMDAGKLNTAKTELEKLPSDFSYNDVSVASLLEQLNSNSSWLAICGEWSNTSGEATSNCKARNYSYDGGTWTSALEPDLYKLDIKCVLNNDGTVSVIGSGSILVFTNWSTLQIGLDYNQNYSVHFNKKLSSSDMGKNISVDDYTTVTLGTDKITLDYSYEDNNSTTTFVYTYKTNVTYGNRLSVY